MSDLPPPVDRRVLPRPIRLWEKVRENVRYAQRRLEAEWERVRVNRALGRRVHVAVRDGEQRLIVSRGDRVTPSAVARARDSGVLKCLLDSVDDEVEEAEPTPT